MAWQYWRNEYLKRRAFHRQTNGEATQPSLMQIELTNRCPMRCVMCPRLQMTRAQGDMDLGLFRAIVAQLAPCTRFCWLHGFGDPLLHPGFADAVKAAAAQGIRTGASANPLLLTPERQEMLLACGLDTLVLSLDGLDAATFKKLRGSDAFDQSVAQAEEFLRQHRARGGSPRVIMSIIAMDATTAQTDEFARRYRALGADDIWCKPFVAWDGSCEDIRALAKPAQDPAVLARRQLPCQEPWLKMAVLWDGRVVPCCYDFDGKYMLGDLTREPLAAIWQGAAMRRLRTQHRERSFPAGHLCASCTADSRTAPRAAFPLDVPWRMLTRRAN